MRNHLQTRTRVGPCFSAKEKLPLLSWDCLYYKYPFCGYTVSFLCQRVFYRETREGLKPSYYPMDFPQNLFPGQRLQQQRGLLKAGFGSWSPLKWKMPAEHGCSVL